MITTECKDIMPSSGHLKELEITQEQIDEKTVALVWRGTKFSGRVLENLLKKLLAGMKKNAAKRKRLACNFLNTLSTI